MTPETRSRVWRELKPFVAPAILVIGENVKLRAGLDWIGALEGKALEPFPPGHDEIEDVG